ncbi:MAG: hypothetical protein ACK58L_08995, partial [Planctomycetota bacterium]
MLNRVSNILRFLRSCQNSNTLLSGVASWRVEGRPSARTRRRRHVKWSANSLERFEDRLVLSANPAHDLVQLDQLRNDPLFSEVDGDTGTGSD